MTTSTWTAPPTSSYTSRQRRRLPSPRSLCVTCQPPPSRSARAARLPVFSQAVGTGDNFLGMAYVHKDPRLGCAPPAAWRSCARRRRGCLRPPCPPTDCPLTHSPPHSARSSASCEDLVVRIELPGTSSVAELNLDVQAHARVLGLGLGFRVEARTSPPSEHGSLSQGTLQALPRLASGLVPTRPLVPTAAAGLCGARRAPRRRRRLGAQEATLKLRSPRFKLGLYLPHKVVADKGKAAWDGAKQARAAGRLFVWGDRPAPASAPLRGLCSACCTPEKVLSVTLPIVREDDLLVG